MKIIFPAGWVKKFEDILVRYDPVKSRDTEVIFDFPAGCKLMIDVGIRILSLIEQLHHMGKRVQLNFDLELFGYLDRMGFFSVLSQDIEVSPKRREVSSHDVYYGENKNLVEICPLPPGGASTVHAIPGRLAGKLVSVLGQSPMVPKSFENDMFTVFSELIGNYFEHSESEIPGFVVAQTYTNGQNIRIAVSDSGLGILKTIRMARAIEFQNKSDSDLILDVFNEGVSRHGQNVGRSCGLNSLGQISIKYNAELTVRMPGCQVLLKPGTTKLEGNYAFFRSQLGFLRGTHLCFKFPLDKSGRLCYNRGK